MTFGLNTPAPATGLLLYANTDNAPLIALDRAIIGPYATTDHELTFVITDPVDGALLLGPTTLTDIAVTIVTQGGGQVARISGLLRLGPDDLAAVPTGRPLRYDVLLTDATDATIPALSGAVIILAVPGWTPPPGP